MNKKLFPLLVVVFLFSTSFSSLLSADNLGQFDARSMAMGGAGVAGANTANAAAYNPALIATEANRKNFAIAIGVRANAYDENGFLDTIDETEESIDQLDSLLNGMDGITKEASCDPSNNPSAVCFQDSNMAPAASKATEVSGQVVDLNTSNLLISSNFGLLAIQFGKRLPMAVTIDGGVYLRAGVKAAESDFSELTAYTDKMADGDLTGQDFLDLLDENLVENDSNNLSFTRGSNNGEPLSSMLEVIGATYTEFGVSFADAFQYANRELAVGITPKIVSVEAIKYHQGVEEDDIDEDDILDDDNIVSKTDFNADIGVVFSPIETQPIQVGVTLKNLFTRTYELKQTDQELELEARANGTGEDAMEAQTDLDNFDFRQQLKVEPQLTAGVAYQLRFVKLMADLDLNEAEVLGRTTQHLALGSEFDAKFAKLQLGYRTAIGGDDEDDVLSLGTSLGPVAIAVAGSGDQYGLVLQAGFSF